MEDLSIYAIDCGSHDVDGHGQYRGSFMVYAVVVVVHIHLCHPLAQTTISVLPYFSFADTVNVGSIGNRSVSASFIGSFCCLPSCYCGRIVLTY